MLVNLIIKNKTFLWLIIFLWFIAWFLSFLNIPKEDNPSTNLPMFVVSTISYWVDSETIEKQITKKLEDEIKSIDLIDKIESVSSFNVSTLIITFKDNKDIIEWTNDLKDAIDKVKSNFPDWTIDPYIRQVNPDDTPVYSLSVIWNYVSKILYEKTRDLEDNLTSISWVSEILITWKPDKKINIYLDYEKLNKYWIDVAYISNTLSNAFIKTSVDKKTINWSLYSYEITTYNNDVEDIIERTKNIDIVNINSQSIKIWDLANIYYEELSTREKSYLLINWELKNSISFDIKAAPWTDIEQLINEIETITNEFATQHSDLEVYETYSNLVKIEETFYTFVSNFRQTWLFVMLILFLFIWIRTSLWVTITFPLVYLMTFIYLQVMGYTFNKIVSFGLILTLWIMVDNLIVITEWIINEINNWIWNFWEDVRIAFKKYLWAIIAWTLTTVLMFLPIKFLLTWTVWQFIGPLSVTIAWTLFVSLFVSIFVLPIILWKTLPNNTTNTSWLLEKPLNKIWKFFSHFTKFIIKNKFQSVWIVLVFWLWLFFSFYLVAVWVIKTDFMPSMDGDNIWVNVKYPMWYTIEQNQEITNDILNDIDEFFIQNYDWYIEFIWVNIWNIYNTSPITWAANTTADNQAYLNIKLTDWDSREIESYVIAENLTDFINNTIKEKFPMLTDIFTVSWVSMSWWKDVWFYIIWDDTIEISNYIDSIFSKIEEIDWVFNVTKSLEYTNWKIKYLIDYNKASRNWMSLSSAIYLFTSIKNSSYIPNGLILNTFNEIWEEPIDMVLYTNYDNNVENVKIWDNFISKITEERNIESEFKNIQHIDWEISVMIEADKRSDVALWSITSEIDKIIEKNPLPDGLEFRYNASIESESQSKIDLWKAFWIWAILMFMILILKYNNFIYPIIIFTSTLLSLIWIIFSLILAWLPLSFPAQIWLFWVIWVWVNNSILFIDSYLSKKRKNIVKDLVQTIRDRFNAIFLTTSTTIAGLVTLAVKDELWWSLAIAFIWGLILNVFITLIYIPSLLSLEKSRKKIKN